MKNAILQCNLNVLHITIACLHLFWHVSIKLQQSQDLTELQGRQNVCEETLQYLAVFL